ncbi:hypothetical protein [Streptomyces sp. NBC_01244]|nr:hypothetical protein OG247_04900 [Streptomyces sp. NBC_01244]
MKVEITAVTTPRIASGRVIRNSARGPAEAVDHGRIFEGLGDE